MTNPVLPFALPGCAIDLVRTVDTTLVIEAHTTSPAMCCPDCGQASRRIHSRYRRLLHDLPIVDQSVRLLLQVRRFFCDISTCTRRTFTEQLPDLAPFRAQRTPRLTHRLGVLGFANGGEAGARVSRQLQMGVSGDTLLRIMRATPSPTHPTPQILGVDDFAFRKGRTYGTILLDLQEHRPIDLLPDRTAETLAAWLRAHPGIEVISRDRALDYARGATEGAPQAIQVADRFHLVGNLREAVERAMLRMRGALRCQEAADSALPAAEVVPATQEVLPQPRYVRSPSLEQVQNARQSERAQRYQSIKERAARGQSIRQIAQASGVSTKTVRRWLGTKELPVERRGYRASGKIDPYVAYLKQRLAEGCDNQSLLWREIREQGFGGTRSLVGKWVRAHSEGTTSPQPATIELPSAKQLSWLLVRTEEERSEEEQELWQRIGQNGSVVEIHTLAQQFRSMLRQREADQLDGWLAGCQSSEVVELRNFAKVLGRDYAAVKAALSLPWSQGPVEGHIHRVKLIKRSGYGRANFDLLRKRVLHAV